MSTIARSEGKSCTKSLNLKNIYFCLLYNKHFLKPRDQTKSGFRNNFLEEDVYYVFLLGMKMVQNVPNGPKWSKMVQLFEEKIPKLT